MGIERIVKNSLAYGTHSNLQIIFYRDYRSQEPGEISKRPGGWRLEGPSAAFVG
jgi:hypothetical protein